MKLSSCRPKCYAHLSKIVDRQGGMVCGGEGGRLFGPDYARKESVALSRVIWTSPRSSPVVVWVDAKFPLGYSIPCVHNGLYQVQIA